MPLQPPTRPQKGAKIPGNWFLDLYDYVTSLEVRGDLQTTFAKRDRSGTVVSANLPEPSGGEVRTASYIAKITVDNGNGTYDAQEQISTSAVLGQDTDDGLTYGSGSSDIGYLYELNGTAGVPVGTFVVVHRVQDASGDPIWYFDGNGSVYGVDNDGAWVEITGHGSGAYSWKQKDEDGSTDTSPSVTGALNAYDVNDTEQIPNGTIVWLRYDGTDYRFEYTRQNFWAKITGESSGSYSWTELQGNASTATTRTGTTNAQEVSGRLGIPTNSIVYMVPHQTDSAIYRFEYHGANAGTLDSISGGTGTSANTDTWDRANQGGSRGEEHPFVARLVSDTSTGELISFSRTQEHDANGHEEKISAESKTILGVFETSTDTYEYVDCATGLTTVARFSVDDKPADDYCWVHDGSDFVKSYNDGISAGAATSPAPCAVLMDSTPANCSGVDFSAFDDAFDDNSFDTCRHDKSQGGNGSVTEQNSVLELRYNGNSSSNGARLIPEAPITGDFSISIDFDNLSIPFYDSNGGGATSDSYGVLYIEVDIGGTFYFVVIQKYDTKVFRDAGYSPFNGTGWASPFNTQTQYDSSVPSSGTISMERSGTDLIAKRGATTIKTWTGVGTGAPNLEIEFGGRARAADGSATCDITGANYTGG